MTSISRPSDLGGIAAMLAATASFVVCDCFMKLATEDLPPFEVLFFRGVAASLCCGMLIVFRAEASAITGVLNGRVLLRAAAETVGTLCYIVALAQLPIADVIAITQMAPLILILGAAFLLRERIGPARVTFVLVGFAGALMVAQPSAAGISPAALFAFTTALAIAARDLFGTSVKASIPLTVVSFATILMVMAVAGVMSFAVEDWVPPTGHHLALLGASGLFVTFGQAGLLLAYRLGRTTVIAPFFYSFVIWGVLAGLFVWGVLPNPLAFAGISLITISGVAIVLLDQRRSRTLVPSAAVTP
jgi:drug/metabolite transporter (DMT)-like permease